MKSEVERCRCCLVASEPIRQERNLKRAVALNYPPLLHPHLNTERNNRQSAQDSPPQPVWHLEMIFYLIKRDICPVVNTNSSTVLETQLSLLTIVANHLLNLSRQEPTSSHMCSPATTHLARQLTTWE